ncbi:hypothetical protein ACM9XA_11320 [Xanthomonas sacchari]
MSSPTPIITPPPKKDPQPQPTTKAQVSLKPQGVESWRVMLKKYTTYAWGLVASLPQLYTGILGLGEIPEKFKVVLWGSAAFGLAAGWIKQRLEH